jgi:hypothetical protein
MNFHNFSICAMLIKFYEECLGTLRLLKKYCFYCLILFSMIYYLCNNQPFWNMNFV